MLTRTVPAPFLEAASRFRTVPVYQELIADLETPISLFLKLFAQDRDAFLLESADGGDRVGRYSMLGGRPLARLVHREGRTVRSGPEGEAVRTGDPLRHLRELLAGLDAAPPVPLAGPPATGLPPFLGGAVGYLGYDVVRHFERLPGAPPDVLGAPDAVFLVPELVAVFDHLTHRLYLVALAVPGGDPEGAYARALDVLGEARARLAAPVAPAPPVAPATRAGAAAGGLHAHFPRERFLAAVRRIQEYIAAGDAFQVVLSQRLTAPTRANPLDIYRMLRTVNPSPYLFYFRTGDLHLVGSSPERLVKVQDGVVEVRPIAGTEPRGRDEAEDRANEERLLASEKERAEHIMLVDLGRNDVGRVAEFGTVRVPELMRVERYSHVMHLVSSVTGRLAPGRDALDALAACFPAGTLTGAPKVRAMEIIDELEPVRRGPYGGAVGYVDLRGNLDTCITIRTLILQDAVAHIQAGAGVVADSDPQREYEETLHKARHLIRTLELAEGGRP
ncbi:anthranilate synthase component I [Caldinitratiruptor microaerophilus]|uniref:Anthranilate synthase component 1 n=1 Tax=Caldinitratiruptor microaerophilus TaxID=671077 RepID=A0AA35CLJ5_9FIRM|nr:anthranilate synthase component I [Caldinitratiruptor microaerophilus]BDG60638.1 anthranilate synthase component I [Caldinitratiruptor microaerophilus]